MSKFREEMKNLMPAGRVMGPIRNNIENYGDLQTLFRNMKPILWVQGEKLFFWPSPANSQGRPLRITLNCSDTV